MVLTSTFSFLKTNNRGADVDRQLLQLLSFRSKDENNGKMGVTGSATAVCYWFWSRPTFPTRVGMAPSGSASLQFYAIHMNSRASRSRRARRVFNAPASCSSRRLVIHYWSFAQCLRFQYRRRGSALRNQATPLGSR